MTERDEAQNAFEACVAANAHRFDSADFWHAGIQHERRRIAELMRACGASLQSGEAWARYIEQAWK